MSTMKLITMYFDNQLLVWAVLKELFDSSFLNVIILWFLSYKACKGVILGFWKYRFTILS